MALRVAAGRLVVMEEGEHLLAFLDGLTVDHERQDAVGPLSVLGALAVAGLAAGVSTTVALPPARLGVSCAPGLQIDALADARLVGRPGLADKQFELAPLDVNVVVSCLEEWLRLFCGAAFESLEGLLVDVVD